MFAGCQITKYIIWQNNNSKCFFSYVYHRPPTWLMNVGVEEGSETQLVQKRPTMHPGNHPVKAVKRQFVLSSFWWDVSSSLYPQVDYESKTCLILRIFMLSSLPLYFKVCVCVWKQQLAVTTYWLENIGVWFTRRGDWVLIATPQSNLSKAEPPAVWRDSVAGLLPLTLQCW